MLKHKITSSIDYNQWLKRLDTQLMPTDKNLIKSPKFLSNQITKRYYKL